MRDGPLSGIRVVETVGLGPGPFAGMLLADMGATVTQVDRPDAPEPQGALHRHRATRFTLDLKDPAQRDELLERVDDADVFIDVFRPGVAERLGIGPDVCLARNPRLVYGRMTGYGQEGPWAHKAGHDIDYLALAGALEPLGRGDGTPPHPPINVLADFAGGGMLLAFGVACALTERARTGRGTVIDAAMVDGAALLMAPFYAGRAHGGWGPPGTNFLDGAAHFYGTYACADGKFLAVGAIEPPFYAALLKGLGLDDEDPAEQWDKDTWPAHTARFAERIKERTRDEWVAIFDGIGDACVAPVLDPVEAMQHPHAVARRMFLDGQPAPAPRFTRPD